MTQQDKDLLLRDLSARLPYGVRVTTNNNSVKLGIVTGISNIGKVIIDTKYADIVFGSNEIKPYLRPMSSMTDEERLDMTKEIKGLKIQYFASSPWEWSVCGLVTPNTLIQVVDWLNAHHFDYRGLIEKGLAIAVTPENNPYNV